jgi:hypothetical protein
MLKETDGLVALERIATATERLAAAAERQPSKLMQALTIAATAAAAGGFVGISKQIIDWIGSK